MADVAVTGSVYNDTLASTTRSLSSITIPADADMAIVIASGYTSAAVALDICCWDGGATQDFTLIVAVTGGTEGCRAYYMLSNDANWPGAGSSKTLTHSCASTPYDDPDIVLFFLSNVNLSNPLPYTAQVLNTAGSGSWTCNSMGSVAADALGIVAGHQWANAVNADPTGYGQTVIYEGGNTGVGSELGEDQLRVESSGAYLGAIAFAVAADSGGGASAVPVFMYHYMNH